MYSQYKINLKKFPKQGLLIIPQNDRHIVGAHSVRPQIENKKSPFLGLFVV